MSEPELRAGPPWAMEEMILAEPGIVAPILTSPAAAEAAGWIAAAAAAGEPVVLTGCGTSEHAAMAGAQLLADAAPGVRARDAFEASLAPQAGGVLVAVSHEGTTAATLAALRAGAARGARAILVTAAEGAEAAAAGGGPLVVRTPLVDRSWCHTVGYLSPLLAFAAMAGVGDAAAVSALVEAVSARRPAFAADAARLAACERLVVVGGGADEVTARELALKVEEGAHVPATPLGVEKVLHGHLPACDERTGLVLLQIDRRAAEARDRRARSVLAAAAELGMPAVAVADPPAAPALPPVAHALVAGALALQLLTLELVTAAGTNPDLIRREEPRYAAAAAAAA